MARVGELGTQHHAGGTRVDAVVHGGEFPADALAVAVNQRLPGLLHGADIRMLSGFGGKRALFQRKGDTDRIELHHLHQHTAGRIHQAADVKVAVPHASVNR